MKDEPAFPIVGNKDFTHCYPKDGMTLRDYFAAKALTHCGQLWIEVVKKRGTCKDIDIAKACYNIADAMLAEHEKRVTNESHPQT